MCFLIIHLRTQEPTTISRRLRSPEKALCARMLQNRDNANRFSIARVSVTMILRSPTLRSSVVSAPSCRPDKIDLACAASKRTVRTGTNHTRNELPLSSFSPQAEAASASRFKHLTRKREATHRGRRRAVDTGAQFRAGDHPCARHASDFWILAPSAIADRSTLWN